MDDADRAEKIQTEHMERTLALRQTSTEPSAEFCVDCDEPIPERRRAAVPGVQKCVFCAEYEERKR